MFSSSTHLHNKLTLTNSLRRWRVCVVSGQWISAGNVLWSCISFPLKVVGSLSERSTRSLFADTLFLHSHTCTRKQLFPVQEYVCNKGAPSFPSPRVKRCRENRNTSVRSWVCLQVKILLVFHAAQTDEPETSETHIFNRRVLLDSSSTTICAAVCLFASTVATTGLARGHMLFPIGQSRGCPSLSLVSSFPLMPSAARMWLSDCFGFSF